MHSDNEIEDDDVNRNDCQFKLEEFLARLQFHLNRLPILKTQLNDTNRLTQQDLYIQKLNEIDQTVHDLADDIRHIEQLHSQLDGHERVELDDQIHCLRIEISRETSEFCHLREQSIVSSLLETDTPTDETNNMTSDENIISNELRQRYITKNHLNESYDLLEQDLASLRDAIDEVAALVAQQEQMLTRTEQLKNIAYNRVQHASTFFQRAIHNRYLAVASGALLGATIGGPVGFMMGTKVGALVALTGSALGAFSMNIMRQRASDIDGESQNNTIAYSQAML